MKNTKIWPNLRTYSRDEYSGAVVLRERRSCCGKKKDDLGKQLSNEPAKCITSAGYDRHTVNIRRICRSGGQGMSCQAACFKSLLLYTLVPFILMSFNLNKLNNSSIKNNTLLITRLETWSLFTYANTNKMWNKVLCLYLLKRRRVKIICNEWSLYVISVQQCSSAFRVYNLFPKGPFFYCFWTLCILSKYKSRA